MTARWYNYSCLLDVRVASEKLKARRRCEVWTRNASLYAASGQWDLAQIREESEKTRPDHDFPLLTLILNSVSDERTTLSLGSIWRDLKRNFKFWSLKWILRKFLFLRMVNLIRKNLNKFNLLKNASATLPAPSFRRMCHLSFGGIKTFASHLANLRLTLEVDEDFFTMSFTMQKPTPPVFHFVQSLLL